MAEERTFSKMARECGFGGRVFMYVRDGASILGVSQQTINDEINAGRMRYHLPAGRKQGKLVRPEWVDDWIEAGTHDPAA